MDQNCIFCTFLVFFLQASASVILTARVDLGGSRERRSRRLVQFVFFSQRESSKNVDVNIFSVE